MIYDHRTYMCKPGTASRQLALYVELGLEPQQRHLGKPVLYAVTEVGKVNAFVHIWAYENLADRTERRAAMAADPQWQEYIKRSIEVDFVVDQETAILEDAPFFKLGER